MTKPKHKFVVPQWPVYTADCRQAMDAHLANGGTMSAYRANKDYGVEPREGSYAWLLEREAEDKFQVKHAIAVNSGTAALVCALKALGVEGKEVITTPYSFSATVSSILLAGGIPVFADVDPDTYCINEETIRKCITRKTRAILPVHLFGFLQDMPPLKSIGLPIIEDACQAVGASRNGIYSGTFGVAGCYSFQGGKNVPAGEGGMIVTNNRLIAETARQYMNHAENFGQDWVGQNYRPTEMQALLAYYGLKELADRNYERRSLAMEFIGGVDYRIRPQMWDTLTSHALYVLGFTQTRMNNQELKSRLAKRGIPSGSGYITPILSEYPAFRKYAKKALPNAKRLSYGTLGLLSCLVPGFKQSDMNYLVDSFNDILR